MPYEPVICRGFVSVGSSLCCLFLLYDLTCLLLLRRISDESHAAHVLALHAHAQAQAQHGSKDGSGHLDRTPSFYTSHSLVNLSGLSVADPAPIHIWRPGHAHSSGSSSAGVLMELDPTASTQEQGQKLGGRGGDGGSREKDLVMLPVTLRRGSWSFGSAGALSDAGAGLAGYLNHKQQQQRGSPRRVSNREGVKETDEGGVGGVDINADKDADNDDGEEEDGAFLTLSVPVGEVAMEALHALHAADSYSYYTDAASSLVSAHPQRLDQHREQGQGPGQLEEGRSTGELDGQHGGASRCLIPPRPASAPPGKQQQQEEVAPDFHARRTVVRSTSFLAAEQDRVIHK